MTDIGGEGKVVLPGIRPESEPDDHVETEPSEDEPKADQTDEDRMTDEGGES